MPLEVHNFYPAAVGRPLQGAEQVRQIAVCIGAVRQTRGKTDVFARCVYNLARFDIDQDDVAVTEPQEQVGYPGMKFFMHLAVGGAILGAYHPLPFTQRERVVSDVFILQVACHGGFRVYRVELHLRAAVFCERR